MAEWIIVYGLIIVFFIALPLVINLVTKETEDNTQGSSEQKNMPNTTS